MSISTYTTKPSHAVAEKTGSMSDARKWIVVILLALGAVIAFTSRMGVGVTLTLPSFIKQFQLTNVDRGVLNSAFFWVFAALQLPMGWIVDRFGIKRPYTVSFFFWGVVTLLTGMTHTLPQLITLRVLTGAFESIIMPASYSWIRRNFEEKRSGLALGIYMLGTKIGPALGAPAAAWLIMTYNWRVLYILIGVLAILWLIPWLVLAKQDAPIASKKHPAAQESAVQSESLVPFNRLLTSPVVWGGFIVNFCYCYFVFYFMTWMPAFFVEYRHLSLSKMGLYTFFSFAGMGIVNITAGWAADWLIGRGGNAVTVRKTFVIVAFLISCSEMLAIHASPNMALFWSVLSLSGLGLASGNSLALCRVTMISRTAVGRVTGLAGISTALAGVSSPILSGWLLQKSGSYQGPMQALWFFQIVAIVTCLVLLREKYSMVPITKYNKPTPK